MAAGAGPGGFMPPKHAIAEKNKEPLPKNIKEVPGYVVRVVKSFFKRLFYIFELVWETGPWILFLMVFIAILNGVLPLVGTYVNAQIINELVSSSGSEIWGGVFTVGFITLFSVLFVYMFLNRITGDINRMITALSGELVTNHIRRKIMKKAKEVDIACFDMPDFYEQLENANREAGMRPVQILNATLNVISTLISIVSYVVVIAAIGGWAALLIAVLALPAAIINFVYRRKTVNYMRIRSVARRKMNYFSTMMVEKDNVKEIRLLDLGDDFERRYDNVFKDYFSGLKRIILSEGYWNIAVGFLRLAAMCALFLFVAQLVLKGEILIGDYTLYTSALTAISTGVGTFISGTATIYEGTLFIDNLISFMNQKPTICTKKEKYASIKKGIAHKIELKNVTFRYPGGKRDILKNVNLTIEPGQTTVLAGLNGAGKTTLIKLITRLYDPSEGEIFLDDINIKEYDTKELYSLYGIVFQDFGRYAVTAKENIKFGNISKEVDNEEILTAAKQSDALDFIKRLPREMDTPLMKFFEEDGVELSTGQWQKLAVARAFYGNNDILILDEPTASLDAIAEQEIFDQFDSLRKGKTTVFVSHRLSSAVGADKIIVIENGEVIEQGNHTELMQKNGAYCKMFSTQAKRYKEN